MDPRVARWLLALVATAGVATPAVASPCDAGALVDQAWSTYRPGGRAPRSFHASSRLELHGPGDPVVRDMVEFYAFPKKARVEYRTPMWVAVTATDGREAWKITKDGPVPADAGHFEVPRRLRDLGALLDDVRATHQVECSAGAPKGRQRLLLTLRGGEMVQVDVDPKTGLIHRYEGESPGTVGRADVMVVELDDWQERDGHWVALELKTSVNGQLTAVTRTQTVRVDAELVEFFFKRPDGLVGPAPTEL